MMKDSNKEWLTYVNSHPSEFTIQYPIHPSYFKEYFSRIPNKHEIDEHILDKVQNNDALLLYIHIPFCEKRCSYCNFAIDTNSNPDRQKEYVKSLKNQLNFIKNQYLHKSTNYSHKKNGIDIGGGTPTLLEPPILEDLLEEVADFKKFSSHSFPLSIETTPKIIMDSSEKLDILKNGGIDRVSIGLQSQTDNVLSSINRKTHNFSSNQIINYNSQALDSLKSYNFKRVNVDLIFGLPNQTQDNWERDIESLLSHDIDSITTYDCLYRGINRPLSEHMEFYSGPEHYGKCYDYAFKRLKEAGYYSDYGSVNFSKKKNESGTSAYFESRLLDGKSYIGLGNYASSWIDNYWFFNHYTLNKYITSVFNNENVIQDFYKLPNEEMYVKYLLYSLNFGKIDIQKFKERFSADFNEKYDNELNSLEKMNLLYKKGHNWYISEGNFNKIHIIRGLFYPNHARKWILNGK